MCAGMKQNPALTTAVIGSFVILQGLKQGVVCYVGAVCQADLGAGRSRVSNSNAITKHHGLRPNATGLMEQNG